MRSVVVLALVLLAGCARPLASGAEPSRPSVPFEAPIDGEPLWLNGTVVVSVLPGDAAAAASPGTPHNCFLVESTGEGRSFLGGAVLDFEWTAASPATAVLNVTVQGYDGVLWEAEGPSPLRMVVETNESRAIVTPFAVRVAPAGEALPLPQQEVAYRLYVGVLESHLEGLAWRQCSAVPSIPPV